MAHTKEIIVKCSSCPKQARVEVFNSFNGYVGSYCRPCGKRRVAEIERDEGRVKDHVR